MIAALSMFYRVSRNEKYLNAVVNAQKFIEENMCDGVQLFTSWRDGKHSEKSFLDDYIIVYLSVANRYGFYRHNRSLYRFSEDNPRCPAQLIHLQETGVLSVFPENRICV